MLGRRVIVPSSCRRRVLDSLHSAHQGSAKMLERAKHLVYWPGIVDDLEQTRKRCSICDRNAPSQAMMPPLPLETPEFPFQMIAMDYFDVKGKSWLAIADRFSGWLSLFPREASSQELINILKNYFCMGYQNKLQVTMGHNSGLTSSSNSLPVGESTSTESAPHTIHTATYVQRLR